VTAISPRAWYSTRSVPLGILQHVFAPVPCPFPHCLLGSRSSRSSRPPPFWVLAPAHAGHPQLPLLSRWMQSVQYQLLQHAILNV
jgi:hypothetical protein